MITVTTEPRRKLIRAKMSGLLSLPEVQAFGEEEQAAVRSMGLQSGEFLLLVETHGETVQTQEVMFAFRELVTNSELKAKRIAIVRTGALAGIQSRRLADARSDYEVFTNTGDAEEWLFAGAA
jgi:hypothetical protein